MGPSARRVAATAAAVLAVPAAAPAGAAPGGAHGDVRCRPATAPRAGLVLLHPGFFVVGATAGRLRALCRPWRRAGFDVIAVDYPVRDVPGAIRAARRAARRLAGRRPVFGYGESAGGTLAAVLAVEGRVDGAVTVAAPTDLSTWAAGNTAFWRTLGLSPGERRALSPVARIRRPAPLLLLHSPADEVVPFDQAQALAARLPGRARVRRLSGGHLADRTARRRATAHLRHMAARPAAR